HALFPLATAKHVADSKLSIRFCESPGYYCAVGSWPEFATRVTLTSTTAVDVRFTVEPGRFCYRTGAGDRTAVAHAPLQRLVGEFLMTDLRFDGRESHEAGGCLLEQTV